MCSGLKKKQKTANQHKIPCVKTAKVELTSKRFARHMLPWTSLQYTMSIIEFVGKLQRQQKEQKKNATQPPGMLKDSAVD